METVEAGRHEEGRAIDRALEAEGGVRIFVHLHEGEQGTEQNGDQQALLHAVAVIVQQGVMRPGHRCARGQQDERVEQRQVPRVEDFCSLRRPMAAREFDARILMGFIGEQAGVEIGPEPGHEEHHFRSDEQDHAVAMADLHDARVVALMFGFLDDVRPPGGHDVKNAEETRAEHIGTGLEAEDGHALHPHDRANGGQKGRNRTDQRPRARIDEVVIVVRFAMGVGHDSFL